MNENVAESYRGFEVGNNEIRQEMDPPFCLLANFKAEGSGSAKARCSQSTRSEVRKSAMSPEHTP